MGKNAPDGFHGQGLAANNRQVLECSVGLKIGELRYYYKYHMILQSANIMTLLLLKGFF